MPAEHSDTADTDATAPEASQQSPAPMNPQNPSAEREDIRAAIMETRLRRWALIGVVVAAVIYFLWQRF